MSSRRCRPGTWWVLLAVWLAVGVTQVAGEVRAQEGADTAAQDRGEELPGDPLVARIQKGLKRLGYELNVIDGLMGPNTRSAIKAFQQDQDRSVTGEATEQVLEAIRSTLFQRSEEAARLWTRARLYLTALGYDPGDGDFGSEAAQKALKRFAEENWLEIESLFSRRMHDIIAGRTRADPEAQLWLCRHFMELRDYSAAFEWCERAGRRQVRDAQYYVGWMYYYGKGVAQSHESAFRWYRDAAKAGDRRAQTYVGMMYQQGKGVPADVEAAQRWFRRAAEGQ